MTEGNKYHREALDCVRTAERMRDPGERAKLFEIARAYLGLARRVAERQDPGAGHRTAEFDSRLLDEVSREEVLAPPA